MGLLDRASENRPSSEDGWYKFIRTLEALNKGVDFSIALYRQLISYFEIEKSALFFRSDESGEDFKCLSSHGYDKTTSNRLRLDGRAVDTDFFNTLESEKKAILCNCSELSFFGDFFSSREFGLMDDIYWIPFIHEGKIISLIMVTQWNSFPPENWCKSFTEIGKRFSAYVFDSRKALSCGDNVIHQRISDQMIKKFIMERPNPDIHLFAIDLEELINRLMGDKVGMNRINLKKEIITVFRTMAGPNQGLLDLENEKVLFLLDMVRISDKGLFIHQLSASLPLLFQDLSEPPVLNIIELNIPESEEQWMDLSDKLLR